MNDQELLRAIETASQAAVDRALSKLATPAVKHGTVTELNIGGIGIHDVIIDGDDDPVAVHDVTLGFPLLPGDRVTILFAPPHQAYIIGRVPFEDVGNLITINSFDPVWRTTVPITLGTGGTKWGYYVDLFGFILGVSGFHLGTGGTVTAGAGLTLNMPVPIHPTFQGLTVGGPNWLGAGRMFDASAGVFYSCTGQIGRVGTTDLMFNFATAGTGPWGGQTPVNPWQVNDDMLTLFVYPREPG